MKKGIIIFIIFIIIVVGGVVLYFVFEKPRDENSMVYSNINIFALNEQGKLVKTKYIIELADVVYKEGETETLGAILAKIPNSSVMKIYNSNLRGQNYYQDTQIIGVNTTPIRVNLKLVKPGNITISKNENSVNVSSNGVFKDLKFCLKYSGQIIYVKANFTQIDKLLGFEKTDKCYDTSLTLNSSINLNIPIEYKLFGDGVGKIDIIFIDSNFNNKTYEFIEY